MMEKVIRSRSAGRTSSAATDLPAAPPRCAGFPAAVPERISRSALRRRQAVQTCIHELLLTCVRLCRYVCVRIGFHAHPDIIMRLSQNAKEAENQDRSGKILQCSCRWEVSESDARDCESLLPKGQAKGRTRRLEKGLADSRFGAISISRSVQTAHLRMRCDDGLFGCPRVRYLLLSPTQP